jgi:hypothetical protein
VNSRRTIPWGAVFIAVTILVAGGLGFVGLNQLDLTKFDGEGMSGVVLLIAGFVTVTLLLYMGTLIHKTLGLGDPREALGMPEGSIRALIALSLILIFSIIGVAVFTAAQDTPDRSSTNLTQAELNRLADGEILSIVRMDPTPVPGTSAGPDGIVPAPEPRFDVVLRAPMSQQAHDFGLQLLSTVSTLVVAVAGFYFGARSVSVAQDVIKSQLRPRSLKVLEPTSPHTFSGDPVDITLAVAPASEEVQVSIAGDVDGRVERLAPGRYQYKPAAPEATVLITFSLPDPNAISETLTLRLSDEPTEEEVDEEELGEEEEEEEEEEEAVEEEAVEEDGEIDDETVFEGGTKEETAAEG